MYGNKKKKQVKKSRLNCRVQIPHIEIISLVKDWDYRLNSFFDWKAESNWQKFFNVMSSAYEVTKEIGSNTLDQINFDYYELVKNIVITISLLSSLYSLKLYTFTMLYEIFL